MGSNLGPLLFLIIMYINDLLKYLEAANVDLFMEDICLLCNAENLLQVDEKIMSLKTTNQR